MFTTATMVKARTVCVTLDKKTGATKLTEADLGEVMDVASFEVIDNKLMIAGYSMISKGQLMGYMCLNMCTCFIPNFLGMSPSAKPYVVTQTIGQKTFKIEPRALKGCTGAHDVQVNDNEFQVLKINYLKKNYHYI